MQVGNCATNIVVTWLLRVTCGSVHRTSPHFTRYDTVHYTLLAGDGSTVVSDYSASTGQENCSRGISARVKRQDMLYDTPVRQSIAGGWRVNKAFAYRPLIWRQYELDTYSTLLVPKEVTLCAYITILGLFICVYQCVPLSFLLYVCSVCT